MRLYPDSPFARQDLRAFTLIELLTAIVIVAVLSSILIAGFRKARDAGDRAACVSNIRQIGVMAGLYAQDNEGNFPETGLYNRGRWWDKTGLIDKLEPYAQGSNKVFYCTAYTLSNATNSGLRDHTYEVQAAKAENDSSRFAYIGYFWTVSRGGAWTDIPLPQRLDGEAHRILASCIYFWRSQVQPHGGTPNFLFSDGHVEGRPERNDVWSAIDRSTLLLR